MSQKHARDQPENDSLPCKKSRNGDMLSEEDRIQPSRVFLQAWLDKFERSDDKSLSIIDNVIESLCVAMKVKAPIVKIEEAKIFDEQMYVVTMSGHGVRVQSQPEPSLADARRKTGLDWLRILFVKAELPVEMFARIESKSQKLFDRVSKDGSQSKALNENLNYHLRSASANVAKFVDICLESVQSKWMLEMKQQIDSCQRAKEQARAAEINQLETEIRSLREKLQLALRCTLCEDIFRAVLDIRVLSCNHILCTSCITHDSENDPIKFETSSKCPICGVQASHIRMI